MPYFSSSSTCFLWSLIGLFEVISDIFIIRWILSFHVIRFSVWCKKHFSCIIKNHRDRLHIWIFHNWYIKLFVYFILILYSSHLDRSRPYDDGGLNWVMLYSLHITNYLFDFKKCIYVNDIILYCSETDVESTWNSRCNYSL